MSKFWIDSYKFSSKIYFTLHFSVHQMVAYNIILELMVVFKLSILMELGICVTKIIEFAFVKRRVSRKLNILKTKIIFYRNVPISHQFVCKKNQSISQFSKTCYGKKLLVRFIYLLIMHISPY